MLQGTQWMHKFRWLSPHVPSNSKISKPWFIMLSDSDTLRKRIIMWACRCLQNDLDLNRLNAEKPYFHLYFHQHLLGDTCDTVTICHCHDCHVSGSLVYPYLSIWIGPSLTLAPQLPSWPAPKIIQNPIGNWSKRSKHLSRNGHAQISDVGRPVPQPQWQSGWRD